MENCNLNYKECIKKLFQKSLNAKVGSGQYSTGPRCSDLVQRPHRPKLDCAKPIINRNYNYNYKIEKNNACIGTEKLNKNAFLSMLGVKKFTQINSPASRDEIQKQEIEDVLNMFDGNKSKAAAYLGVARSTLQIKLNKFNVQLEQAPVKEENSPNQSRKFFENIKTPWSINSFNSRKREVCIEIKNNINTVVMLSQTIQNFK